MSGNKLSLANRVEKVLLDLEVAEQLMTDNPIGQWINGREIYSDIRFTIRLLKTDGSRGQPLPHKSMRVRAARRLAKIMRDLDTKGGNSPLYMELHTIVSYAFDDLIV